MSILEVDSKGRMTLPKRIRESLNIRRRVLLINAGDHLKIIPLPSGSPKSAPWRAQNQETIQKTKKASRTNRPKRSRKGGREPKCRCLKTTSYLPT